ncbi:hypothetical protein [Mesorhizobium sp.]|uniref:hypothetical protein n=1 Tax=Mesorhizobium sp. TaxID=1871066 RepID=UPI001225D5B4|nr:hypothetical protein [Mesorhizobium sp.]TIQ10753.1 MAG: hypothetical protein E5X50_08030 [Mesorhizobium sp.]
MSSTKNFQLWKGDQLPANPLSARFAASVARAANVMMKGPLLLWQFWCMRSDLAVLAQMDRRELADIGLLPTDIGNALASIGPDKTGILARVVNERRHRRQQ